jgi:hypothetical protein
MRSVFQRVDDKTGLLDSSATFVTLLEVGFQGLNPEPNLVVEQEVDLVWKKVPVIHWVSGALYGGVNEVVSELPVLFITKML